MSKPENLLEVMSIEQVTAMHDGFVEYQNEIIELGGVPDSKLAREIGDLRKLITNHRRLLHEMTKVQRAAFYLSRINFWSGQASRILERGFNMNNLREYNYAMSVVERYERKRFYLSTGGCELGEALPDSSRVVMP